MTSLSIDGARLLDDAVDLDQVEALRTLADQWYERVERLTKAEGAWSVAKYLPPEARYTPAATSIGLGAVFPIARLMAALSPAVREQIASALGQDVVCDVDIAWLRRQYPPAMRPEVAQPHAWHQDGAFGYDFSAELPPSPNDLLPMVTVWIPLNPCGQDAPGIEIQRDTAPHLLPIADLVTFNTTYDPDDSRLWRPMMTPGQALLMAGRCLHRTYSAETMTHIRTSAELRFFPANPIPDRVKTHQMVALSLP